MPFNPFDDARPVNSRRPGYVPLHNFRPDDPGPPREPFAEWGDGDNGPSGAALLAICFGVVFAFFALGYAAGIWWPIFDAPACPSPAILPGG